MGDSGRMSARMREGAGEGHQHTYTNTVNRTDRPGAELLLP